MTTTNWDAEHEAERPSWDCANCGRPWPCDPAREQLKAHLGPVIVAIHMWGRLDDAVLDLRGVPTGELYERFLSWTR